MISVVIPTFKKTDLLIKNLRNNLQFLDKCEIIVVNDDPAKSIQSTLKQFNITIVENAKNLGFYGAEITGVKRAKNKYILLINDDVILEDKNYLGELNDFEKDQNFFDIS